MLIIEVIGAVIVGAALVSVVLGALRSLDAMDDFDDR